MYLGGGTFSYGVLSGYYTGVKGNDRRTRAYFRVVLKGSELEKGSILKEMADGLKAGKVSAHFSFYQESFFL